MVVFEFVINNFKSDRRKYLNVRQLGSVTDMMEEITNATPPFLAKLLDEKRAKEKPETKRDNGKYEVVIAQINHRVLHVWRLRWAILRSSFTCTILGSYELLSNFVLFYIHLI